MDVIDTNRLILTEYLFLAAKYGLGKSSKKKKTEKSDIVQKGRVGWTPKTYF